MKRTIIALIVLSVLFFVADFAQAMDKNEVQAKIAKVASYLRQPGGPGSNGKSMFTLLLEAILLTAPESGFPPEFTQDMEEAKKISDSASLFEPNGVVYLHKAYRLIHSGKDFEMPASIAEIQDAVNYATMLLATAGKNLKVDKFADCVRNLLETALLIVTPKERQG